MRILHTADWHLGRIFHGVHLTDDQAHVLHQLVEIARETSPDLVVLAGDVYDRAVPPPEAVSLFDDVLSRLVLGLGLRVVVIAGNHDGPERIDFGGRLLRERGLYVVGMVRREEAPLVVDDEHGRVHVCALPFAEPQVVRERLLEGAAAERFTHGAALALMAERALAQVPLGERAVAVAHGSVLGASVEESERPLWACASGYAEASCLAGFCYAALGHHHRAQTLAAGVEYAGAPLAYSFGEASEAKSVSLVEIDGAGRARTERVTLTPRHALRVLEGTFDEVLRAGGGDDYLKVVLTDDAPVLDAMARLRQVFPNVLAVEQPRMFSSSPARPPAEAAELDERALFARFFEDVTGAPFDDEARACLDELLGRGAGRGRERAA